MTALPVRWEMEDIKKWGDPSDGGEGGGEMILKWVGEGG